MPCHPDHLAYLRTMSADPNYQRSRLPALTTYQFTKGQDK